MTSLLLLGATGLVGGHVLELALKDDRVTRVVAPTRRPLPPTALPAHPKLENPITDLSSGLPEADWWTVDAVISALGTTRAKAGSDEAFRLVDYATPLGAARRAYERGATRFSLVSSTGANSKSSLLYLRTKGELEDAIRAIGFLTLTIVRPGLLGGDRSEFRLGERLASIALKIAHPILPRRLRISPAHVVAKVLLDAAIGGEKGERIVEADQLSG